MKKYQIIEGIARADVAYEVYGKTVEELFVNAAEAVSQTMVDTATIRSLRNCKLQIANCKLDELLLEFLEELIILKDSRRMLFSKYKVNITDSDNLKAELWGEKIDPIKHKLKCDVKAITRHKFFLRKENSYYIARIVLDI